MDYHTPDSIWTIFSGVTDFESYAEKFVVKGRLHKDVPPEVVEGYAIAEHIMAYAYYRYPAMDEALVKLLRVLEMAVKMRCKLLGITLETLDNKGKARKKVLNTLINELAAKEAAKPTKGTLIWLKDVRNYLMHPSETSLLGSVAVGHIRQCVVMLNALFLPERYFEDAKTELERVRSICRPFGEGLFVLEHAGHRYLVYRSEFVETYFVDGEWLVLCAFLAVPADLKGEAARGTLSFAVGVQGQGFADAGRKNQRNGYRLRFAIHARAHGSPQQQSNAGTIRAGKIGIGCAPKDGVSNQLKFGNRRYGNKIEI